MNHTPDRIELETKHINNLSHLDMARIYRFAESGHLYFDARYPYYDLFMKRFNKLGGMTPEVSKAISL